MFIRKRKSRQLAGLGLGEVVARCRRKREKLDRLKGGVFRGVSVVVRRELNLAKPMMLLAGFLVLALGIAIGYWSQNIDSTPIAELSAPPVPPPVVLEARPQVPSVPARPVAVQNNNRSPESSPPDTLLRGVRELLEKIKRGE